MAPEERKRIARASWAEAGRTFAVLPLMGRLTEANGRVEVVGREHLEEAVAKHIPTIFFSGHFSNYEIMAAVVVQAGIEGFLTYRPTNNPYFDARIVESRRRYGVKLFAAKGVDSARELLKTLAKRDFGRHHGRPEVLVRRLGPLLRPARAHQPGPGAAGAGDERAHPADGGHAAEGRALPHDLLRALLPRANGRPRRGRRGGRAAHHRVHRRARARAAGASTSGCTDAGPTRSTPR